MHSVSLSPLSQFYTLRPSNMAELINFPVGEVFGEFHKTQWDLGGETDIYH